MGSSRGWTASGSYSVAAIGAALIVTLLRGPWEEGWIGWHGGYSIRKKNKESADGKETVDPSHLRMDGKGRILITGSIAGFMPGSFQAVYNGTKAFIDSFSFALRNELKDSGVTVTCLMPGATETEFFERAGMEDTQVGQQEKDDPAKVAQDGFEAMMNGEGDVVSGWKNKIQSTLANITPAGMLAEQHRIVAKVDQLMSLCDALEAKLTQSQTDSEKLMNAAVRHLLTAYD